MHFKDKPMSNLRDLFHRPAEHAICGQQFIVYKLQFSQFDDALHVAHYLQDLGVQNLEPEQLLQQLEALKTDNPARQALCRTLAGCLSVKMPGEQPTLRQLAPDDIEQMPFMMLAEALAVVLEVNADFFFQTLPRLLAAGLRIRSNGLALLNRLSAQGTAQTA
jgi:hypothetical protein